LTEERVYLGNQELPKGDPGAVEWDWIWNWLVWPLERKWSETESDWERFESEEE